MTPQTQTEKLKNDRAGWVLVSVGAMLWGTDLLLRPSVLSAGVDSVTLVLGEHLALTVLFAPVLFRTWRSWTKLSAAEIGGLLFIAWGGSAVATVLLTKAYAAGEPFTATLLQKLQPAFAVALAGPVLKERPRRWFYALFAVAMMGAYLMSFGLTWAADPVSKQALVAAQLAVCAAAIWGFCTVIGRWTLRRLEPFTVAGIRFVLALPVLLAWNLLSQGTQSARFSIPSSAWLPLMAIVLFPDALGMVLYYIGLRRTTASLATLAELAYPATAIILAYPTTHDFTPWKWLGLALLVVSLYFIRLENLVTPRKSDQVEEAALGA